VQAPIIAEFYTIDDLLAQPALARPNGMQRALVRCHMSKTTRRTSARTRHAGFTLIELMIVVSIVGILSTLAVVGYRKLKSTEATQMVQAIRIAQESYRSETGQYANLGTTLCPTDGKSGGAGRTNKVTWDATCNGGNLPWRTLPMSANSQVAFGYYTIAGRIGSTPPASAVTPNTPATNDWFFVYAQGDTDATGAAGLMTEVRGSSFTNDVQVLNEGN
jgi:prepilin-type N-terminal cleavage/methylation domain-containing protein